MHIHLDPNIWGPHAWILFDSICISYPEIPTEEEKKHYKQFFYSLIYVLPCDKCKKHFKNHLKKHPLDDMILSDRENMIKWLLNIHNNISKENRKKDITLNKFYKYYDKLYKNICSGRCNIKVKKKNYNIIYKRLIFILFGIIIIYILYNITKKVI